MGSHPYCYFTPYQNDVQEALEGLREQEFKAGRYFPATSMAEPPLYMFKLKFPPDDTSPAPGARHGSIDEAIDASGETGTGSILDITRITDEPGFSAACPLPPHELIELFGTAEPTRERLETVLRPKRRDGMDDAAWAATLRLASRFWDPIGRGQARYVVVYDKAAPREIFFAGYSVD
jgi:hypothetical protein